MSEIEQKPVDEQTENSVELAVSAEIVEEAPLTSNNEDLSDVESLDEKTNKVEKTEDKSPEIDTPAEEANPELNYLGLDIFNDVREVSMEELLNSEAIEEVPQEEQDRYPEEAVGDRPIRGACNPRRGWPPAPPCLRRAPMPRGGPRVRHRRA